MYSCGYIVMVFILEWQAKTALDLARDEGHQECCILLEAAMGMVNYCNYIICLG